MKAQQKFLYGCHGKNFTSYQDLTLNSIMSLPPHKFVLLRHCYY